MLDTQTAIAQVQGNGTWTDIPVPYFTVDEDWRVVSFDDNTLVETVQVLNGAGDYDYTVAGAGNEAGGTITINTAPSSNIRITCYRRQNMLQGWEIPPTGPLDMATLEVALDQVYMAIQRVEEMTGRSARQPLSDLNRMKEWPAKELRADKQAAFDSNGDPIVNDGKEGPPGPPGDARVQITAADTTPDYLFEKVEAAGLIILTVLNPGDDESLEIDVPQAAVEALADARIAAQALLHGRHSYDLPAEAWVSPDDSIDTETIGTTIVRRVKPFDPAVPGLLQYNFPLPESAAPSQKLRGVILYEEEAGATTHNVVFRISVATTDKDTTAEPAAWADTQDVTHTGVAGAVNYVPFDVDLPAFARGPVLFLQIENLTGDPGYDLDTIAYFRNMRADVVIDQGNDGDAT